VRIGMFSPYSLSLPGGVQGQVLGLARALRRQGHNVRVLGPCDGPPPEPGVTPLGNAVPLAANGSVAPIAPDPSATLRTIRALNDEEFDVLHLHEPIVPGPNLSALIYKPTPILGTFHAAGRSSSYKWLRPIVRWAASRIDIRTAVSPDAAALAGQFLGGTFHVLFNGVETKRFDDAIPWPKEGPTILFVGRHEERKGLRVLLEAHTQLGADVRLWVAGTGPLTAELQAKYKDPRISWLGRISDGELSRRFRAADAYAAPSLGGESFGVVLLEAMAANAPVVASDIAGYRNVATDELDALLVPPGDAIALSKALSRAIGEPGLAAELRRHGALRASGYSMDRLAGEYVELYRQIV
jgi:phosphatidyl-myo-inositol alpha-mannosyltransferase